MRIAVTSQNKRSITSHAGKCRHFWVYEIVDGQVRERSPRELTPEQTFHESHGEGAHPLDDIQVLISGGMGTGLQARLGRRGIVGLVTTLSDPDAAVTAYLEDRLPLGQAHPHGHHHAD